MQNIYIVSAPQEIVVDVVSYATPLFYITLIMKRASIVRCNKLGNISPFTSG